MKERERGNKRERLRLRMLTHGFVQAAHVLGREAHLDAPVPIASSSSVTLDGIVKQYLRDAHGKCLTPVALCPSMSLTEPHVCPQPSRTGRAPLGIHERIFQTQRNTKV